MTLRADAARNREAIVEAARAVFAEHGLDAPLDEIAKRAGTGNATLYRRFPTRGDLVAAVFADRMADHVDAVEAGLADEDPWRGFASYIEAVGAMQARDRGIADLVTLNLSAAPEIEALRARAYDGLVRLVARAHEAGVLRADFTDQDVVLLLMANAGLIERAHGITGVAWLALDRALRTTRARCVDRSSLACSAPQPGRIGPRTRNARVSGEAFAWLASRLGVPKLGAPQVRR